MNNNQLIKEAIRIFHEGKQDRRDMRVGDIMAHISDPYTYEIRSINRETVTGFFVDTQGQEHVATFPRNEVFNPGAVKKIALRLQRKQSK